MIDAYRDSCIDSYIQTDRNIYTDRDRQTDRQTYRQTQRDRQTDRHTDIQTGRPATYRQ